MYVKKLYKNAIFPSFKTGVSGSPGCFRLVYGMHNLDLLKGLLPPTVALGLAEYTTTPGL